MQNTLIDNSENLKLVSTLNELILKPEITQIMIATGYWDLPGLTLVCDALKEFLSRDGVNLRLLIGKDPYIFARQTSNPKYKGKKYPEDFIRVDLNELEVKDEYLVAVELLLDLGDKKNSDGSVKFEIRKFIKNENDENQFLHSKCYVFMGEEQSYGIIGSSNFTQKGLEGNSELNYLDTVSSNITARPTFGNRSKGHQFWFEEKWKLGNDWTKEFLEEVLRPSKIAQKIQSKSLFLSPYEAYIKVLIDQFGSIIESDYAIDDYLPRDENFKVLKYQTEAVRQGFSIMKRHGGFILADVVGLGKTFTAIMVIKRYLLNEGFSKSVLVITPPAIKKSWQDSIRQFDKGAKQKIASHIFITTIGCLDTDDSGELFMIDDFDGNFTQKNYGLVVIDESHRFRNNSSQMYQKLDDLIAEQKPYVMLLSATPQNNRPNDLANQIYLFQRERTKSTLGGLGEFGNNLESFFAEKEKIYEECIRDWKKGVDGQRIPKTQSEKKCDLEKLEQITNDLRDYVVNQLVIRRTRTDIKKYYADDMKGQNLIFPEIKPPEGIPYEMKGAMANLFFSSLEVIAPSIVKTEVNENGIQSFDFRDVEKECLGYFRYRAIEFLKSDEHKKIYEYDSKRGRKGSGTVSVKGISERLAAMMEMHLVKRLESSREAFEESLNNFKNNTQNMLDMMEANRIFICPDINVNEILSKENREKKGFEFCLDELCQKARKQNEKHQTNRNREFEAKDFSGDYKEKLKNDLRLVCELIERWAKEKSDPKIDTFTRKIDKFMDKTKNPEQKLVIFTECIATQTALAEKLKGCADEFKTLSVTAKNRDELQEVIAANFDANFAGEKKDDFNILITTDVLSEGVNLHRSNSILNYDSPWNATRLMQRLGRINRIGSASEKIYSFNFYPSATGDAQINLYKRTLVKLQAFHNLFGEDSQIYTTDEKLVEHELAKYDLEENESPNMKFIMELKDFYKSNREKYEKLKSLDKSAFACVNVSDEAAGEKNFDGFTLLHKKEESGVCVDSVLYMTKNGNSSVASQTQFVQSLKDISRLPLEKATAEECEKIARNALSAFDLAEMNSSVKIKSKFKAGKKEKDLATEKVQKFYTTFSEKISEETSSKLDEIADSVSNGNSALIRKINSAQIEGIFDAEAENIVGEWHALCGKADRKFSAENCVTFVLK